MNCKKIAILPILFLVSSSGIKPMLQKDYRKKSSNVPNKTAIITQAINDLKQLFFDKLLASSDECKKLYSPELSAKDVKKYKASLNALKKFITKNLKKICDNIENEKHLLEPTEKKLEMLEKAFKNNIQKQAIHFYRALFDFITTHYNNYAYDKDYYPNGEPMLFKLELDDN